MAWRHGLAVRVVDETGEQPYVATVLVGAKIAPVCRQDHLHLLPKVGINDWGVFAWIGLVFMYDLAAIEAVLQHVIECSMPSDRSYTPIVRSGAVEPVLIMADEPVRVEAWAN
jgi:hypothetical protein